MNERGPEQGLDAVHLKELDFLEHNVQSLERVLKQSLSDARTFKARSEHEFEFPLRIRALVQRDTGVIVEATANPVVALSASDTVQAIELRGSLVQRTNAKGQLDMEDMNIDVQIPESSSLTAVAQRRLRDAIREFKQLHSVYIGHPESL
jgi:hypothetical protein